MGFLERFKGLFVPENTKTKEEERVLTLNGFNFDDTFYPLLGGGQSLPDEEKPFSGEFLNNINSVYKSHGFAFAVMAFRQAVFSQIDFSFKRKDLARLQRPRPGDLFEAPGLDLLRNPWPGGSSADLLTRMLQDTDLAGNAYIVRKDRKRLLRLRPDWVTIVFGSDLDADNPRIMSDATIIGYIYSPPERPEFSEVFLPEEVGHWAPLPDPSMVGLGMSWLVPILGEIREDKSLQNHVVSYLENGANPGTVLTFDPSVDENKAKRFLEMFQNRHKGSVNAYKTLILGGGASEVSRISADLKDLSVEHLTSGVESRIAMASGVHPMLLGTESSLQHGSFNAIQAARRVFSDRTMRPLWNSVVDTLAPLVDTPTRGKLWYDDNIPFLREDMLDRSKTLQSDAITMRQLIDGGFKPDTVKEAVVTQDLDALEHTGLFSVQLRPPFEEGEDPNAVPTGSKPVSPSPSGNGSDNDSDNGSESNSSRYLITYEQIESQRLSDENERLKKELEYRRLQLSIAELEAPREIEK